MMFIYFFYLFIALMFHFSLIIPVNNYNGFDSVLLLKLRVNISNSN